MLFRIRIRKHEIGLRFRHGELQNVMQPGAYFSWILNDIRIFDRVETLFSHQLLDVLLTDAENPELSANR